MDRLPGYVKIGWIRKTYYAYLLCVLTMRTYYYAYLLCVSGVIDVEEEGVAAVAGTVAAHGISHGDLKSNSIIYQIYLKANAYV